ncbi:hypothetical protein Q3G72_004325 [Acer saccharum]|nr:hypothetical protein Q3G72_004325 [Acer saccharum]
MKYVKPCILYKETLKKTNKLLYKDAIGVQLLGLNVLSDYVSIAIADHDLDVGLPYGIVEKKGRNIRKLTKVLQTLYWTELLMKEDPDLPDDHPENNIDDFDDIQSAVYILQSYIDHSGLVKSKGQTVKGRW